MFDCRRAPGQKWMDLTSQKRRTNRLSDAGNFEGNGAECCPIKSEWGTVREEFTNKYWNNICLGEQRYRENNAFTRFCCKKKPWNSAIWELVVFWDDSPCHVFLGSLSRRLWWPPILLHDETVPKKPRNGTKGWLSTCKNLVPKKICQWPFFAVHFSCSFFAAYFLRVFCLYRFL